MNDDDSPVVLIVEDEPDVAETYRRWLEGAYAVRLAADGPAALDVIDETVDVVLLDRMMPGMSGQEVLAAIRERGLDCRVAMVTAVDADFDVIEMGFDEYLGKPPDRDELEAMVERLSERAALEDDMQEYYSLVARRSALQTAKTEAELAESEEYTDLVDRIEAAEVTVDEDLGDMADDTDFVGAVREIMDDDEVPTDVSPGDPSSVEGERR